MVRGLRRGQGRRVCLAVGVAIVLFAAYLVRVPFLVGAGCFLIEDDPPEPADAIVVLAGSLGDRIREGVALYQEGFAPRILVSRGSASRVLAELDRLGVHVPRAVEVKRSVAEQLGVPPSAIIAVGGTERSTLTEAEVVVRYARRHGYATLLLVTSRMHTRRAAMIFRHVARGRPRIVARPSRFDPFRADDWWHNRIFQRRVVFEYQKMLVFLLIDFWREPASTR